MRHSVREPRRLIAMITLAVLVVSLSATPSSAAPLQQPGTIHRAYITNVNDLSFVVSWATQNPSTGSVNYGTTTALGSTANDSLNPTATTSHYVEITGLSANTTYYFDTISDSTPDNNGGAHYSVTTGPALLPSPGDTLYGLVIAQPYPPGTPLDNAVVYIQVQRAGGNSQWVSSRTTGGGFWFYALNNIRTANFQNLFNPANGETILVVAQGGSFGTGQISPAIPGGTTQLADIILNGTPTAVGLSSFSARSSASNLALPLVAVTLAGGLGMLVWRKRRIAR